MNQVDILFSKALKDEKNLEEFVILLKNGLNFNLKGIEEYIHKCITKNNKTLLTKILEAKNLVHLTKPAITKVTTMKMAIINSDEDLTILLLKAIFDLNLNFSLTTFDEVVEKTLGYIEKQGYVKALNYMIKRYDPLRKLENLENIKELTKKMQRSC